MWLPLIGVLVVATFWVAFIGAPYVPTRRQDVERLFDLLPIGAGERLVDLGSGDGRLQLAAARRGIASTGYELSAPLVLVSLWRLRRWRSLADVRFANFWKEPLPADTSVVFTFLATKFMAKLERHMQAEAIRLNKPLLLVSYACRIEGRETVQEDRALLVYRFTPQ